MPTKDPTRYDDRAREDWRLRLAPIKESAGYREFWAEYAPKARQAYEETEELNRELQSATSDAEISAAFELHKEAVSTLTDFNSRLHAFGLQGPYCAALTALDPRTDDIPEKLPLLFCEHPATMQVETPGAPLEGRAGTPLKRVPEALKPSERILKIDLSRKRGELVEEFKRYLDTVEYYRTSEDVPEAWRKNYEQWEPDRSRFRAEAWQALKVYRLRRNRKSYLEISRTLEIKVPAAKKAFRRAYELIENRPYDKAYFRREVQLVRLPELQKTCDTCPAREACEELCPDVLAYCQQDKIARRERCESELTRDDLPI